ncbi:hypothetical protein BD293_4020 [Roseinatronobacter monicus]|uniref:Uncharacterized protein n=1 Tax=Roseinatronobacter monicus TaxID=393481 RepID=A0A543K4U1_9RHOB|nr:hypothetical protein [Roseinatronobacter monicus]TQM90100.1 hypothetical protein BD293_4020 [Roseinatronobacter monicus]
MGVAEIGAQGDHVSVDRGAVASASLQRPNGESVSQIMEARPRFARRRADADGSGQLAKDGSNRVVGRAGSGRRAQERCVRAGRVCVEPDVERVARALVDRDESTLPELRLQNEKTVLAKVPHPYQFIYLTLRDLVETHGISDSLVFDGEVQTYLARFLMHQCGFFDHATPNVQLANCLAGVWAALPLVSGPERGQSAYAADGINKAFAAPETVLDVLGRRFKW